MAVRHAGPQPLAPGRPTSQPRHLRAQSRFVDEDELGRIEVELAVEPGLPSPQDKGATSDDVATMSEFRTVASRIKSLLQKALREMREGDLKGA